MASDPKKIAEMLLQTWPAKMGQAAWNAFTLPGDVYQGKATVPQSGNMPGGEDTSAIGRVTDLAGGVMGGGYPMAQSGALGIAGGKIPAIQNMLASGRTPLFHDTSLSGAQSILAGGAIEPRIAWPSLGDAPAVSVTRDFTNYSRRAESPYRLVISKEDVGHSPVPVDPYRARPNAMSEAEERFSQPIPTDAVRALLIDRSNPNTAVPGLLNPLLKAAEEKQIPVHYYDGPYMFKATE